MKYISFFFLCLFLTSSCRKNDPVIDVSGSSGQIDALQNGQAWQAQCFSRLATEYKGKFSLSFTQNGQSGRSLNFRYLPLKTGSYTPLQYEYVNQLDSLTTVSCYSVISGDIAGDTYRLLDASSIAISVDEIGATGLVKGTFSGTFVKVIDGNGERDLLAPDTLVFSNGRYETQIND